MFEKQSERTKSNLKPRFPRLKFMEKKREQDLRFYADDDYMLHVVPCTHGKGK